jgi:predicted nuclease of restriction endonuclease-like (RecB) superfamily
MARKKKPEPAAEKKDAALTATGLPADYAPFLESLKSRVRQAQTKAMLSVNRELIQLYWEIGRLIVERQEQAGWGKGVVDRLAADVQKAFPGMSGFSPVNVWRMRAFYLAYRPDPPILSQPVTEFADRQPPPEVAGLPWGHNQVLLFKLKDQAQRLWYAARTLEHGWSRAVLTVQIESDLFNRQGRATTNFTATLPRPQSDLAQQSLKVERSMTAT